MNAPHTQLTDTEADFLRPLRELVSEYPADLWAARRGAFVASIPEQNKQFTATDGRGQQVTSDTKEKNDNPK
jgi:hypothetical protein